MSAPTVEETLGSPIVLYNILHSSGNLSTYGINS